MSVTMHTNLLETIFAFSPSGKTMCFAGYQTFCYPLFLRIQSALQTSPGPLTAFPLVVDLLSR